MKKLFKQQSQKTWEQAKREIQNTWSVLSLDDIDLTKGNIRAFCGLVECRVGLFEEKVRTQLRSFIRRYFK